MKEVKKAKDPQFRNAACVSCPVGEQDPDLEQEIFSKNRLNAGYAAY